MGAEIGLEPGRIHHFVGVEDAAGGVPDLVRPKDLLLVKASRGMALERIVDALESRTPSSRPAREG